MYNEEIKRKYISEIDSEYIDEGVVLVRQFEKSSSFEAEKQIDIYNWSIQEITEYYRRIGTGSLDVLEVINARFLRYVDWIIKNNLKKDSQNHFREINNNILVKCLDKKLVDSRIVSREELISKISILPNPSDQFVLLALFEGFKGKDFCDIRNIKTTDIDVLNNSVKLSSGRSKKISKELIEIAFKSAKEFQYRGITQKSTRVNILVGEPEDVIKEYPNIKGDDEFRKGRNIYNKITRSIPYCGLSPTLTANAIFESGKIAMINELIKESGLSTYDCIYEYRDRITEQYSPIPNIMKYIRKYNDYLL